ncbi:DUF2628 domain-containing protein [Escherichia coli]|uniref:DUF2628 domain-containing protein n=1 Tax=Escherichia coli TaxID=562 RepID=UPI00406A91A4
MSKEYMNDGSLSEKWKYRFNFYDQHGFPGFWGATPEYKAAFKALKVRQRLTIQMNFIAFFCSWIYLFVLGLWKKAIIVLLLGILSLFVGALIGVWICPYISRHLLSLNPLLACCRRYSRGER